jgi:hypothetical protein
MTYVPIIVSLLSLCVAGLTLFMMQFRAPRISVHAGPVIKFYYLVGGGCGLYVPTTFINDAARMGVVFRAALTLMRTDNPQERFFLEWSSFSAYDSRTENWRYDDIAHALAVPGRSAVNKLMWFNWMASSTPALRLREGEYVLTVHYWTRRTGTPSRLSQRLHVSGSVFDELESYRTQGKSTTVEFVLDRQLDRNRLLTPHEARTLLGV